MEEQSIEKKYVLITGASSGIGREISLELARQGYSLVLVARDKKRLQDLKEKLTSESEVDIIAISADLQKRDVIRGLNEGLKKKGIRIFGLVNNAGFGTYGYFDEKNSQEYSDMIELNIHALTMLTYELIDDLKKTEGFIMNISSIAGLIPLPYMAVYGATKSYVTSFTEALSQEYPTLRIFAVHPGPVETGFQERAGQQEWTNNMKLDSPENTAREAVNALDSNEIIVFTNGRERRTFGFAKLLPRKMLASRIEKMMRPRAKKE